MFSLIHIVAVLALSAGTVSAQYAGWRHSGSFYILTTPDGANLPESAREENFPVLVRLHKGFFDFSQAQPHGEDLRFSLSTGESLAYQIEQWNAQEGVGSVWVRVPVINGNSRQEIRLHWGNSEAKSESNGATVFNESNGFAAVFHMNEPVLDATGALQVSDRGTAESSGIVGTARHLAGGQGVFCGDQIESFPVGSDTSSTHAWFRPEIANARVLGWGNEAPQGKIILDYRSPASVQMECYFSGANVNCTSAVPMSDWVHVVHTYQKGESLLYINGVLDAASRTNSAPLHINRPARMWIGGWYNDYRFVGDIDEVRISKVVRSADWVRLEYENQKPLQTLTGHLVQPGNAFRVSPEQITVAEGKSAMFSARAEGAQKVYWVLRSAEHEAVVATDQFDFTFHAGRVSRDQTATLRFKAIYPNEVKIRDIPITIKEDLPEPVFTLTAPSTWNGDQHVPPDRVTQGPVGSTGCLIVGSDGTLSAGLWNTDCNVRLKGASGFQGAGQPEVARIAKTQPRIDTEVLKWDPRLAAKGERPRWSRVNNSHMFEWALACAGDAKSYSPFEIGAHITEVGMLGVLALRMQKPIIWDAEQRQAVGLPEADAIIDPAPSTEKFLPHEAAS